MTKFNDLISDFIACWFMILVASFFTFILPLFTLAMYVNNYVTKAGEYYLYLGIITIITLIAFPCMRKELHH